MSIRIPDHFSMTRILLRLWDKYERGQPCGVEAMVLVKVDSARVRWHGIPSFAPEGHVA